MFDARQQVKQGDRRVLRVGKATRKPLVSCEPPNTIYVLTRLHTWHARIRKKGRLAHVD